jgi:hypothetical protein
MEPETPRAWASYLATRLWIGATVVQALLMLVLYTAAPDTLAGAYDDRFGALWYTVTLGPLWLIYAISLIPAGLAFLAWLGLSAFSSAQTAH